MNSKLKIPIAILQIIVGVLGFAVCIKNVLYGGKAEMTAIAILLTILGLTNGIKGISDK